MDVNALRRARELRGLSVSELARRIGVSQPTVSQIESGRLKASTELTTKISSELGVPVSFLVRSPWPVSEGSLGLFRAHSSKVTKSETMQLRQTMSTLVELMERLAEDVIRPQPGLAPSEQVVGSAVRITRAILGYSSHEPLGNLTRRLEKAGVSIAKADLKRDAVFGYSIWLNGATQRPFVALSHFQTPYRMRWTLAHEVGHLVLGHEFRAIDPLQAEREADQFAGSLLVPPEPFMDDLLGGVNLSSLAHLKLKYGVSIAALVRRAYDLGLVDHSRYESLNVQISQKGWRKSEPGDEQAPYEEPILLRQLAERKYGEPLIVKAVSDDLGLPEDILYPCFSGTRAFLEDVRVRHWLAGAGEVAVSTDERSI